MTVNSLEDSIADVRGTSAPRKVFRQIIKGKYNLKYVYNYGIVGTRIARQIVPTKENTRWDLTFELRSDIMQRNADCDC